MGIHVTVRAPCTYMQMRPSCTTAGLAASRVSSDLGPTYWSLWLRQPTSRHVPESSLYQHKSSNEDSNMAATPASMQKKQICSDIGEDSGIVIDTPVFSPTNRPDLKMKKT